MTTTQWAIFTLGYVIGGILYWLTRRAISAALDRKHAPDSDLPVRLTLTNRRRLIVLLSGAANIGGSDLWRYGGGSAGNAYVFLDRMEDAGLVASDWEAPRIGWAAPAESDSPRRRFYRLTPEGRAAAMKALNLREGVRQ